MILDSFENVARFFPEGHGVRKVVEEAKKITPETFPAERKVLDGDRLFMNFFSYQTHEKAEASFEAHRKYLDVMIVVSGSETVYVKPVEKLKKIKTAYDEGGDYLLAELDPDATAVRLTPGSVLVLFPGDAHAPGCVAENAEPVQKIVGKVLI